MMYGQSFFIPITCPHILLFCVLSGISLAAAIKRVKPPWFSSGPSHYKMEEVVKTLRDAAGESVMSQATAIAQRHLPERMATLGITYAQLEPFNWKALTALLKEHI